MLLVTIFALIAIGSASMLLSTVSGGGNNVVMIPILVLVFNFSPGEAIGTSFLALTVGSAVAVAGFVRAGQLELKSGVAYGAQVAPGVVIGTYLSYLAEGPLFRLFLGLVVTSLAAAMLLRGRFRSANAVPGSKPQSSPSPSQPRFAAILLVSTGFFAGFFGQGAGLVLVPVMQFIGLPIVAILGTVRIVGIMIGATGTLARLSVHEVNFGYGAALAVGTAIGGFLGAKIGTKLKAEILRVVVASLIALLGALLVVTSLF